MSRLSIAVDRVRNVPGLGRDAALVATVLVAGLAAITYLVGNYGVISPWKDKYEFSADFDQGPGIQLAGVQEVRIAGIKVGKIVEAEPTKDGNARLTFKIDEGHQVYENARLVIRSKTPLNVMYVSLDPGGPPAAKLKADGVIPVEQTDRVLQPYELLDQLDPRARQALTDLVNQADVALANGGTDLAPGLNATEKAMKSFEPVFNELRTRRANIAHLVTAVAQISNAAGGDDKRLASLVLSLQTTLKVVSERDGELGRTLDLLPGLTSTLDSSMRSAAALTDQLTPTLKAIDEASGKLPAAVKRLTSTVEEAHGLITEARPVIAKARPVLADLRPLTANLNSALGDLAPVVSSLPSATQRLIPWLNDLGGFVYNTASSFSLGDVNGNIGRAQLVIKVTEPMGAGF
jgi:phospholipid/cholesterol/gamma-HCH transport system substrate-binding protein